MENVEAHTMKLLGTVPAATMKSSAAAFYDNDVIYGRLRPYLNKVCKPGFKGLCSSEFIVFPEQPDLHSSYLQYRLNATDFVRFSSSLNAGDRPRVDFEQIGEFEIELPPPEQQKIIVGKIEELFSDLDAGVAALKRAQANLKRYRAAVLKAAVEGRLTEQWRAERKAKRTATEPAAKLLEHILAERRKKWDAAQLKKYANAGKAPPKGWQSKYLEPATAKSTASIGLPDGWCCATANQICEIGTGTTPSRGNAMYWNGGTIPWISSAAVNKAYVREAVELVTKEALKETTLRIYPKHTLILALYGEGKTRGKVSELLIDATINQALAALQTQGVSAECREYLKLFLFSNTRTCGEIRQAEFSRI